LCLLRFRSRVGLLRFDVGGARYICPFPLHVAKSLARELIMPITDVAKKQLAQKVRLHYKVCRTCGARNPGASDRCRKCHSHNLRWKKRELGAK
jgi:large subunit ribosomal protein L40e